MKSHARILVIVAMAFVGFRLHATSAEIHPSSGKELCSALIAADFTKAGIAFVSLNNSNTDSDSSSYCTYNTDAGTIEMVCSIRLATIPTVCERRKGHFGLRLEDGSIRYRC
jgi:hypothetical protein